ncbi:nad binding domain of 6-phosphogluconate [Cyclospora cayetanensis]|uniref:Nad binding domain of 6-phosphogluconate n=1 Tax=Cyclospora cayetanensis TaxID=88456 RepID=A0A1D3D0H7_9EIME|nr:nad binding domain of 6-phosphogluconate [Cyclospora cayetanensis]
MACIEATPGKARIGWIGTGVMGVRMCENLLKKGFTLSVHTRTPSKAVPLQQLGASVVSTAQEVAERSDILCLMVGTPADVKKVLFGPQGAAIGLRSGCCLIDFTTSDPALAEEVYVHLKSKGVHALDAPVSGGDIGARDGTLTVMAGGDPEALEAKTKLANQITLCTNLVGLAEGLLYAERAGLDLEKTLAVLMGGAATSWSVETYGPRVLAGNFNPGFAVAHLLKDLRLALAEAARIKLALPGLSLALQLYEALEAQGGGVLGVHALKLALQSLNSADQRITDVAAQTQ